MFQDIFKEYHYFFPFSKKKNGKDKIIESLIEMICAKL